MIHRLRAANLFLRVHDCPFKLCDANNIFGHRPFSQANRNFIMQPVVSDAPRANADGAATQMKRKPSPAGVSRLFRPRHRHQKFRMLDEPGPDELLDDWMISGPATEPTSSD